MKVGYFSASVLPVVIATILAFTSALTVASPVHNPFLDHSTWSPNNPTLDRDPSSWTIGTPPSSQAISTAVSIFLNKRHDYAMICADKREHTEYCQRSPREYYCSQNGYVVQRKTATVKYTPCEDQCVCMGVVVKPICLVGWKGSTTCLRSLPEKYGVQSMDVEPQYAVGYRGVAGDRGVEAIRVAELANRAAKPEAENTSTPSTDTSSDSRSPSPIIMVSRQGRGAADGWFMFCNDKIDTILCGDRRAYQCNGSGTVIKYLPDAPRYA